MKHIFTLIIAAIFANSLMAQSFKKTSDQLKQHHDFVNGMMQLQSNTDAERSVPTERVIAQSTYDNYMGSKADSVKLSYGLNGTSTYDFNMMLFAYNYPYNSTPMFNFLGTFSKPQILSDTYDHWTIDPNTLTYGFFEKGLSRYDSNKNLIRDTALFVDSSLIPNMTYINKFNAANNIDTGYSYMYHLGASNNAFKQFFSYNVSNKITKDSIYAYHAGAWHFASKTFYTYDLANNLIQIDNFSNTTDTTYLSPLTHQLQYMNTYDGSNRLITVQTSYDDGTSFLPYVKDTFAYTGASVFHTSWKEYQYDAINSYWAPMSYMTKTLNGFGFPDIINIQSFDSLANAWVPSIKQMVKYDSYNNPDTLDEYDYNFTSFPSSPDFSTYYYYESFVNTTSINEIPANEEMIVYPNPAVRSITVSGIKSKSAIVSVLDISGRIQTKEQVQLQNGTFQLSLEDLTPGVYLINVQEDSGNVLHHQRIVKVRN